MQEYDEFEPQYREMDPATEKLLFDGSRLRNGMIVLFGSPELRVGIREEMSEDVLELARTRNRWAIVSELEISVGKSGGVAFIATYADHTERKIVGPMFWPWLVKRDSIPADYDPSGPAKQRDALILGKLETYKVREGYEPTLKEWAREQMRQRLRQPIEETLTGVEETEDVDVAGTLTEHAKEVGESRIDMYETDPVCDSMIVEQRTNKQYRCTKPSSHNLGSRTPHADDEGHVWARFRAGSDELDGDTEE